MKSFLQPVPTNVPEAPYPPEIRARGWAFDLDLERIEQSDTWVLAPAEMRPWLLMLWATSWKQTPAGSYPNDDALIAARIGMDLRQFAAHRDILMRGWRLCADGRLYHDTITKIVLQMTETRAKDRNRMEAWRGKRKQKLTENVTRNTALLTRESQGCTTPTPTPTPTPKDLYVADATCTPSAHARPPEEPKKPETPSKRENVPYEAIISLYHEILPMCPRVRKLTDGRRRQIRGRMTGGGDSDIETLEEWRAYFGKVAKSRFLTGRADATNGRKPFVADLEWLSKEANFVKVLEGKYDG